ncbi:hypothetical protein TNCV_2642301 [Trichonephila clavipes]|nr:hypothetical protein TNCV_2642301 [Trichonephila clavipes]
MFLVDERFRKHARMVNSRAPFVSKFHDMTGQMHPCDNSLRGDFLHSIKDRVQLPLASPAPILECLGFQLNPGAHQAGFSWRFLAGVGFFESVGSHGPGLALLAIEGVQQQQQYTIFSHLTNIQMRFRNEKPVAHLSFYTVIKMSFLRR